MHPEKIAVIGSNSFSGATFVRYLLDKDHNVLGFSRSKEPEDVFLPYKWLDKGQDRFRFEQADLNYDLEKIIEIFVEEKATGEISAGAGVGTDGTTFMFAVKENNWLGRGVSLDSSITVSAEKLYGRLALINPNYNFSGNTVFADFSLGSTDTESTTGFKSQKTGISAGTQFEQYEDIYIAPAFDLSYEEITTSSTASSNIKKMEGTFTNLDFRYTIVSDQRNQAYGTTDGYRTKFSQTIPLILDQASLLNTVGYTSYHSLTEFYANYSVMIPCNQDPSFLQLQY